MGIKLPALPEPIICPLHPARGRNMRDVFLTDIPLFSDRLLSALREAGVDNIDTYHAEVHSPEGDIFSDYKAVNIIGLVSCADLQKSVYLEGTEPPMMGFQYLVIDEEKARDLPFFRLAENSLYILVADRVKKKLDELPLVGVKFDVVESTTETL
jgi:hypothetical protein